MRASGRSRGFGTAAAFRFQFGFTREVSVAGVGCVRPRAWQRGGVPKPVRLGGDERVRVAAAVSYFLLGADGRLRKTIIDWFGTGP